MQKIEQILKRTENRKDFYVRLIKFVAVCLAKKKNNKKQKTILTSKGSGQAGLCSEERSLIAPDYARNWICDFILGRVQNIGQLSFNF